MVCMTNIMIIYCTYSCFFLHEISMIAPILNYMIGLGVIFFHLPPSCWFNLAPHRVTKQHAEGFPADSQYQPEGSHQGATGLGISSCYCAFLGFFVFSDRLVKLDGFGCKAVTPAFRGVSKCGYFTWIS